MSHVRVFHGSPYAQETAIAVLVTMVLAALATAAYMLTDGRRTARRAQCVTAAPVARTAGVPTQREPAAVSWQPPGPARDRRLGPTGRPSGARLPGRRTG